MRRLLLILAAWALTIAPSAASAQGLLLLGVGAARTSGGGGGGYTGPVDAFASAAKYGYSMRAISATAAAAQVKAFRLGHTANAEKCDVKVATTGHAATVVTGCTGGSTADGFSLATWCAQTAGSCFGDTWYEQNGSGADAIASATAPVFVFNCFGTDPCFQGGGAGGFLASSATATTQAGGLTISAVAIRTSGTTQADIISGANGTFFAASGRVGGYFGASTDVAETDNAWHALQWYINGSSSAMNVDGTDTTSLAFGAGDLSSGFYLFQQNTGQYLTGKMFEVIVWAASSNSTQRNAVCANQRAFTGISGTC